MKVLPNGGLKPLGPRRLVVEGLPGRGRAGRLARARSTGPRLPGPGRVERAPTTLLEKDIVPLFYSRGVDGLARPWIARIKKSMKLTPTFSTNRMLYEYGEHFYRPAAAFYERLTANEVARARALADWKRNLQQHWGEVRIESAEALSPGGRAVGRASTCAPTCVSAPSTRRTSASRSTSARRMPSARSAMAKRRDEAGGGTRSGRLSLRGYDPL